MSNFILIKSSKELNSRLKIESAVFCVAAEELFIDYIVSYIAHFVKRNRL